jgi:RNA recognition motif-containing protein
MVYNNSRHATGPVAPGPPHPPLQSHPVPAGRTEPIHKSVKVLNLPTGIKKPVAQTLFERFGKISTCKVQLQRDNQGRVNSSTAYARYLTPESAERAIRALDGRYTSGRTLFAVHTSFFDSDNENGGSRHQSTSNNSGSKARSTIPKSEKSTTAQKDGLEGREGGRTKRPDCRKHARGPLVVDGARGNARRRRDTESKSEESNSEDESDSDSEAINLERAARRRGSDHSTSSGETRSSDDSGNSEYPRALRYSS